MLCDRKDLVPVIIHRIWPLFRRGAFGGMELALIWIPGLDLGPGEQAEGWVSTPRIPRACCMQCTAFPHPARAYRCAPSPNLCFLGPGEIQRRLGQAKGKTWGSACPRSSPAPVTPTLLCAFLPVACPSSHLPFSSGGWPVCLQETNVGGILFSLLTAAQLPGRLDFT